MAVSTARQSRSEFRSPEVKGFSGSKWRSLKDSSPLYPRPCGGADTMSRALGFRSLHVDVSEEKIRSTWQVSFFPDGFGGGALDDLVRGQAGVAHFGGALAASHRQ